MTRGSHDRALNDIAEQYAAFWPPVWVTAIQAVCCAKGRNYETVSACRDGHRLSGSSLSRLSLWPPCHLPARQLLVSSCNGLQVLKKPVICFAFLSYVYFVLPWLGLQLKFGNKLCYQEGSHSGVSHHSYFSDNFFTAEPELEAEPLPWEIMPSSNRSCSFTQGIHETFLSLDSMTTFHVQTTVHDSVLPLTSGGQHAHNISIHHPTQRANNVITICGRSQRSWKTN